MITFFKPKGSRGTTTSDPYAQFATLTVDAAPNAPKAKTGFTLNKKAGEVLGLNFTGEEYIVFAQDNEGLFLTVATKEQVEANQCYEVRVGKSGRGNNKRTWKFVTGFNFVGTQGATLRLMSVNDANTIFQVVELYDDAAAPAVEEAAPEVEEDSFPFGQEEPAEETADFEEF